MHNEVADYDEGIYAMACEVLQILAANPAPPEEPTAPEIRFTDEQIEYIKQILEWSNISEGDLQTVIGKLVEEPTDE